MEKLNQFFSFISSKNNQNLLKRLNLSLSILCLFFIYRVFLEFNNTSQFSLNFESLEILLPILAYLFSGTLWSNFMKQNYSGNIYDYFYNWSFSKIGKFIPSGIMTLTVRLNQKIKNKRSSKKIMIGILEEQFLFPAIVIPSISLCFVFDSYIDLNLLFLFFSIFSFYILKYIYFKLRNNPNSLLDYPFLFFGSLFLQYFSLVYIASNLGYDDPAQLALFYFLSSSIGLFFVGVPSGVGVREVIFFSITNNFLGNVVLFEYALKIRILYFLVDLVFGFLGFFKIYFFDRK